MLAIAASKKVTLPYQRRSTFGSDLMRVGTSATAAQKIFALYENSVC